MDYNSEEHIREEFNELEIVSVDNGLLTDVDGFVYFANPYSVDLKQCEAYLISRELEKHYYNKFDKEHAYNMFSLISATDNNILVEFKEELKQAQNIHDIFKIKSDYDG